MTVNTFHVKVRDGVAFYGAQVSPIPRSNSAHCDECGARLRREKAARELCDPCDDQRRRDREALDQAMLAAGPQCKLCGERPVCVRSGIYAWLCFECRSAIRNAGIA